MTPTPLQLAAIAASLARQGLELPLQSELVISNEWLGKMLRQACEEAGRASFEPPQSGDITETDRLNWIEKDNNAHRLYKIPDGFMVTDSYGAGKSYSTLRETIDAEIAPNLQKK